MTAIKPLLSSLLVLALLAAPLHAAPVRALKPATSGRAAQRALARHSYWDFLNRHNLTSVHADFLRGADQTAFNTGMTLAFTSVLVGGLFGVALHDLTPFALAAGGAVPLGLAGAMGATRLERKANTLTLAHAEKQGLEIPQADLAVWAKHKIVSVER